MLRNEKDETVLSSTEEKLAFFLNLHNFTILFGLCKAPPAKFPKSILEWAKYSQSLSMKVDQFIFNPFEIEQAVVRASMGPPSYLKGKEPYPLYSASDSKAAFKLPAVSPLANFGFHFPHVSSPPLKLFTPQNVMGELKEVAIASLQSAGFGKSQLALNLPAVMKAYEEDFLPNASRAELFKFLEDTLSDHAELKRVYQAWYFCV